MYSVYRLRADELDNRFLHSLRALFGENEIEIVVSEVSQEEGEEQVYEEETLTA